MKAIMCDSCGKPGVRAEVNGMQFHMLDVTKKNSRHSTMEVHPFVNVKKLNPFDSDNRLPELDLCVDCFVTVLERVIEEVKTRKPEVHSE